jgi:hypothetical protein
MKETPILFTPGNVQAILDGSKVQTRRIVKSPLIDRSFGCELSANELGAGEISALCPFGAVGDRLWVRETWRVVGGREYEYQQRIEDVKYKANLLDVIESGNATWRPSIFMPKWACRLRLEITNVRIERLQDCSSEDAIAEGASLWEGECDLREKRLTRAQLQYAALWDSINGACSWDANPWVWAITFKRLKP